MRKMLTTLGALLILASCNRFQKTENGIEYKIIKTDADARQVAKGDMLLLHMRGMATSKDTVLFDSYVAGKPFYIPADEPTLKEVFAVLKKGDSLICKVIADTLYLKSFGQPLPPGIKPGEIITFYLSINDLYSQKEMQNRIEDQNIEFRVKDSISLESYLKGAGELKSTTSGLRYQVVKEGKGKQVKKGDKITVKYRGTFLDGKVFDETKDGQPDFTFNVGLGQVIQGWDEGLQLMKEGDTFKFIIPWNLAYGSRGSGPISPYTTLVFEVQLMKVN